MGKIKDAWKRFLRLGTKQYHIYTSYFESDMALVTQFIQILESFGCLVYDMERDADPGKLTLKESIDNGIENSKMSFLFVTKQFITDDVCSFLANVALRKYIQTKGKHRVIPLVLEPCKLPKYLTVLNCVHLWKYKYVTKQQKNTGDECFKKISHFLCKEVVIQRLFKAITGRPPRFRRIHWYGYRTLTWSNNFINKIKLATLKEKATTKIKSKLPFLHFFRLLGVLDHCVIYCKYNHCSFACSGSEFSKFIQHIKTCKYRVEKCPNKSCLKVLPKWQLQNHLDVCDFTLIKCSLGQCGKLIARCRMDDHIKKCGPGKVPCQNSSLGCGAYISPNEQHLKVCPYELNDCHQCGMSMFRKDFGDHIKVCLSQDVFCPRCKKKINGLTFELVHSEQCPMVKIQCSNIGCNQLVERYKLNQHKDSCRQAIVSCPNRGCNERKKRLFLKCHVDSCEYTPTVCIKCGDTLPRGQMTKHRKQCIERIYCPACKNPIKRQDYNIHLSTCPKKHPELPKHASKSLDRSYESGTCDMSGPGTANIDTCNIQISNGPCLYRRGVSNQPNLGNYTLHPDYNNGGEENNYTYCKKTRNEQSRSSSSEDGEEMSMETVMTAIVDLPENNNPIRPERPSYKIHKSVVGGASKSRRRFHRLLSVDFPY